MAEIEGVVIDFGDGLVSSVRQHLTALGGVNPENYTIFRVPARVRGCNKRLYEPEIVSIGPYHHGNPACKAMQMYKWQCLRDLLARGRDICVDDCIRRLRKLEPRARRCYFEPVELDGDEFVKMLLLDGCFVIEFLIKCLLDKKKDAVCNTAWSGPLIRCDLLLLDNQIPFFIIESLFALLVPRRVSPLMELLVMYITWGERKELPAEPGKKIHHLLHVHHLCFVSTKRPNSSTAGNSSVAKWLWLKLKRAPGLLLPRFCISKKGEKRAPCTIPCATELQEAGVTFTKKEDKKNKKEANSSGSFLDITFRNGILEIPFLSVEDSTPSDFANLVAFEQCMGSTEGSYMTSYVCFMDCIINTAKDVAILQNSGIIENMLASDEELAIFLNQLGNGTVMDCEEHYLAPLFTEVREYCDSKRHKWRAKLMKDYFSNPWAIFSLVAAIALLIFTFLQTFFTIFPYYHPRN
ncbi:UPF0481 protein At3g47200-like [Ananas comosus]|uniref:UPF0481 protein At3g47200-like n=1 Tax=Ananas comosus TaxID=4615 RepID=A0A6P5EAW8_ANACO|nr:UPF0481 protein At3g47200-like [Ananas comosus]